MANSSKPYSEFAGLLLAGDHDAAITWAREILEQGMPPLQFFQEIYVPALVGVGDRFGRLDIFLPELIEAADTAKAVNEQLIQPMIAQSGASQARARGKVVLGSVRGDVHDIGKNMVALMLEVNGFEVIDLGVDVPPRAFIEKAIETGAEIVGLSALMTTSMPYMKEVVELREGLGLQGSFRIMVGGAPITQEYSAEVGADGYGRDAVDGVQKCVALVEGRR